MAPCTGKTALVTGASRGIGRAAALALAEAGATAEQDQPAHAIAAVNRRPQAVHLAILVTSRPDGREGGIFVISTAATSGENASLGPQEANRCQSGPQRVLPGLGAAPRERIRAMAPDVPPR